jgi:predicted short-subunit dehydrogenase-like oxidoreductase (DUF2520 family)
MTHKSIAIVGSGNVATHLALALSLSGHAIRQVYSRNINRAQELATAVGAGAIDNIGKLSLDVDVVVMAVSDRAIPIMAKQMAATGALVVHTAGSVGMDALDKFANHGVLYPFQTFTKGKEVDMPNVPFLLEANSNKGYEQLNDIACGISQKVMAVNSDQRLQLHIAAVFSCNFVNHLYEIANNILSENNLSFELLLPLIKETSEKIKHLNPLDAQTGPAVRGDMQVIQKHLSLIGNITQHDIYKMMSQSIIKTHDTNHVKRFDTQGHD